MIWAPAFNHAFKELCAFPGVSEVISLKKSRKGSEGQRIRQWKDYSIDRCDTGIHQSTNKFKMDDPRTEITLHVPLSAQTTFNFIQQSFHINVMSKQPHIIMDFVSRDDQSRLLEIYLPRTPFLPHIGLSYVVESLNVVHLFSWTHTNALRSVVHLLAPLQLALTDV